MQMREWPKLFRKYQLSSVFESAYSKINDEVIAIPKDLFERESDDYLAASVASKLVISKINLLEEEKFAEEPKDVRVDVSNDFMRGTGPNAFIDGIELVYVLPFAGSSFLLESQASTYTASPTPRAFIRGNELRFPYEVPERDINAIKKMFDADLPRIKNELEWVNRDVETYNRQLEARVRSRVTQRRTELERTKSDLSSLGIPIRGNRIPNGSSQSTNTQHLPKEDPKQPKAEEQKEYAVALSFAGEDRSYIEDVAKGLKDAGIAVFYDAFEQGTLWGVDLTEHLGNIYARKARYVILFASKHYVSKAWPKFEKQHALSRYLTGLHGTILPVKFDDTEIPGLPTTVGFLDLRVITQQRLIELIIQKAGV